MNVQSILSGVYKLIHSSRLTPKAIYSILASLRVERDRASMLEQTLPAQCYMLPYRLT